MHFDIQRFNVAFSNYVTAFVDISLAWYRKITHFEALNLFCGLDAIHY